MTHPNLAQRQADAIKARRADIITVREGQVTATIDHLRHRRRRLPDGCRV